MMRISVAGLTGKEGTALAEQARESSQLFAY